MKNKVLKIAFSGPSGMGKSTLCKFVRDSMNVPWLSTSAGDILTSSDKVYLRDKFNYKGEGHRKVINLSSENIGFGLEFQELLLKRRGEQILTNDSLVIDRCPIDNVAYFLSQNSHNLPEDLVSGFIKEAQRIYQALDFVIQIRYSPDIPFIEDNGSRVANRFFQIYSSDVFSGVYSRYFANLPHANTPRVLTIDFWDLEIRKQLVKEFINPSQLAIDLK
jgi:hypothetical protein